MQVQLQSAHSVDADLQSCEQQQRCVVIVMWTRHTRRAAQLRIITNTRLTNHRSIDYTTIFTSVTSRSTAHSEFVQC